jgi:hypothetical protein
MRSGRALVEKLWNGVPTDGEIGVIQTSDEMSNLIRNSLRSLCWWRWSVRMDAHRMEYEEWICNKILRDYDTKAHCTTDMVKLPMPLRVIDILRLY